MNKYLINLDRSADRLNRFTALHHDLKNIHRFSAVDGINLSKTDLIDSGAIASDVPYTMAELGCYMSHTALWQIAVKEGEPITIIEDDAILSVNFDRDAEALISSLSKEWDFVMWGWNFDAYLTADLIPGVSPAIIACSQDTMRRNVDTFRIAEYDRKLVRLIHGMGLLCYSVSAKGARELLSFCTPLRRMAIELKGFGVKLENHSIDRMMNAKYRGLQSYVSIPPLAVSENDKSKTTIEESSI